MSKKKFMQDRTYEQEAFTSGADQPIRLTESLAEVWERMENTPAPRYPRLSRVRGELWVTVIRGRDYYVPNDPERFIGLLQHLSAKKWCSAQLIYRIIALISRERPWSLHPIHCG
jgi:hypothetical protein